MYHDHVGRQAKNSTMLVFCPPTEAHAVRNVWNATRGRTGSRRPPEETAHTEPWMTTISLRTARNMMAEQSGPAEWRQVTLGCQVSRQTTPTVQHDTGGMCVH